MTTQQLSLSVMTVIGVILFFAGRVFAKKTCAEKPSFMPSFTLTLKGAVAYFSIVISWAGLVLAVICVFLLFS